MVPSATQRFAPLFLALCLVMPLTALAQDTEGLSVKVEPAELTLKVGEKAQLNAKIVDADGVEQEHGVFFFSMNRRAVSVTPQGEVTSL